MTAVFAAALGLPGAVWTAATGKSQLPVFDLTGKKASFLISRKHIRPLGTPGAALGFSYWRLAHAIKKAEWTRYVSPLIARVAALGFLLENGSMFDPNPANLRLAEDAIELLDDFSRASLAGRIAQGIAVLQMEKDGYRFIGRFSAFCRAAGVPTTTKGRAAKAPDFVFERTSTERALAESKGGFVGAGQSADIKGTLAEALGQLAAWGSQFSTPIAKKFAFGTFLREANDNDPEPSLMVVVDPPGEADRRGHDPPPDTIQRLNYSAWLRGMGYSNAGRRLIDSEAPPRQRIPFLVGTIAGSPYAFAPLLGPFSDPGRDGLPSLVINRRFRDFSHPRFFLKWPDDARAPVAGIRLDVLRTLGAASATGNAHALLELAPEVSEDLDALSRTTDAKGSRLADGTFFGTLALSILDSAEIEEIDF